MHLTLQIHYLSFADTNIFEAERDDKQKLKLTKFRAYPPRMVPHFNFNAENDSRDLSEALDGSGTNEQRIIDIATKRSNAQRQEIVRRYDILLLGRDLIADLNYKLSGKFRDIIIGLMTPLNEYLCKELHKSLTGLTTDEDALVEILCTKTNKEMAELIVAYDNSQFISHLLGH